MYVINHSVIDLRKEPSEEDEFNAMDPLRETQLLYGEVVELVKEEGQWAYIRALEQQKYLPDGSWSGYPGWVKRKVLHPVEVMPTYDLVVKTHLSMGTKFQTIKENGDHWVVKLIDGSEGKISKEDAWLMPQPRTHLIDIGRSMIGFPYFWGGRHWKCIDCSGFVNLLYRVHGMDIPRDAHDQYLKATPCESKELAPGDLVFTASEDKPERMSHVMLYSGEGRLLEATAASGNVREIPAEVRFSCPLSEVKSGQFYKGQIVYFGKL